MSISHDLGFTIYSKEIYDERLKILSTKNFRDKIKIIVSHTPPYHCLDLARRFGQTFLGSKSLREAIENDPQIKLVVCGHVHLHGGKHKKINDTLVVNSSSHDSEGSVGNVAIIDIDKTTGKIDQIVWNEIGSTLSYYIFGIGNVYANILEEAGYNKPEDLLQDSLEIIDQKTNKKIGKKRLQNFVKYAEAYTRNEIIYNDLSSLPSLEGLENSLLIDIETDLNQTEIWCIGTLFQGEYNAFFLENPTSEKYISKMLNDFCQFLDRVILKTDSRKLYSYSGTNFDFRVLKGFLYRNNSLTKTFEEFEEEDLFFSFRKSVFLPINTLKLKDVTNFLNYQSELDDDYDGMMASFDYYTTFNTTEEEAKQEMKKKLLVYNEDDLRRIIFLWKELFTDLN